MESPRGGVRWPRQDRDSHSTPVMWATIRQNPILEACLKSGTSVLPRDGFKLCFAQGFRQIDPSESLEQKLTQSAIKAATLMKWRQSWKAVPNRHRSS
ncbi:hypothetical protein RB195_008179 [Necator americanus]|uniref:Uncharacterized protein n=1 Tax=Necator americanus TaxID=51031 RepID=A0ABR1CMC5_NECAM